jgi:hypothetical protein
MDLRIASIAIATDSILLSRNLRDFRQVPGLSASSCSRKCGNESAIARRPRRLAMRFSSASAI